MTDTRDRTIVLATMMQPAQANPRGTVHGGEIMKMMDTTAGGAAIRYSKMDMVTARVDELQFLEPIHIADYVTCVAQVVYVGRTSLEVYVTVDVENLRGGVTKRALDAYFTMVALGEDGHPAPIPTFEPTTPDDIRQWEYVEARRAAFRRRR